MASTEIDRRPSRVTRLLGALTTAEWWRLAAMLASIVALHLLGWLTLVFLVAPAQYSLGGKAFGVGIGLTAYTLGMRHAFDADHIAAIDNTTRKLMNDGQRPLAVGFFFSLGHSTVVFALALLLAGGVKTVVGPVEDDSSTLHHYTGLIGTSVSGVFLYAIALLNLIVLAGILRVFARLRRGEFDPETDGAELERQLQSRGLMNRVLGRLTKSITKSWHCYPIGLLFGLGFDTATEIALLVLAGTSAAAGLPWYAIICLPVLFAAGMCLLDTIDGSFMNFAYGWAFSNPVRKIYYNITITALSVAVALLIGSVELLVLFADQFGWRGAFWTWIGGLDLNAVGYVVVGMFVLTWAVALLVWRYGRIEEKWGPTDLGAESAT
ncbi:MULTISPECIES: HoxN/HupN/NixA family nickel/cobalt transporter [Mycobacterium]|uniref:HoxN/HupN/NixA family nickel/cobalt transporter n=1 Tax=Mycobacterium TaxID=1763 RepID=UPI00025D5EB5|nr:MULTISPECIES: HoxN/HupN/NixA family nickel/cobalt transporter [Mycobacterium]AFJ36500.1 transition metal uptake transporter, Ni2+-Co2+ transporter (NiCoT) family protein [Mycobacterium sp. MOTT36Y]ASX01530.1 HoxN/HupN/NixA family nickel/cobalt transporter [Mycobacterium intracellulare subsp. chimaera]ELR86274.1 transition metal uptake transporter, Ni2+-Co2+ transporter (NiCoT) family protein [Mycobacterium sp. H4Y]PBA58667.1 HoxN/HupN/NixA family nickel/cobalt transporter [Mycobacterium intr